MDKKLIIITGPTAAGKTEISIRTALRIGGEIVSADSMQVYRSMDIGSAKVKKEEMRKVRHHLIDILDPKEEFNVYLFKKLAGEAVEGIYERGNIPIIAGGTGFYIQALLYDVDFEENKGDDSYRKELSELALSKGPAFLHKLLKEVDPDYANEVHENNVKRVIRALEFYRESGQMLSEHNRIQRQKLSEYDFKYYVINMERELLYKRIDQRVDKMMDMGLLDEVRYLKDRGIPRDSTAMQGIGYKELYSYLMGETELAEAVEAIKKNSRHYAKRQITWFKRERDVIFLNKEDYDFDDERIAKHISESVQKG
ncbi:MAG: tRNA (adenosine(37)-N6)-dimethylallyltransferase MiaA [Lachnospiraceae bacterium]|nr:tRNA (adenosine(37)-N6)-dimethylallyltransferase MiaA [Lachnospiraceae bacterium]